MCSHTNNARNAKRHFAESESNISDEDSGFCYTLQFAHDYAKCCYRVTHYLTWGTP